MLTLYRRHTKKCKFTKRSEVRCKCPVWCDGKLNKSDTKRLKPLNTTDWNVAVKLAQSWELAGRIVVDKGRVTVSVAVADFISDLGHRGLQDSTIRKFRTLLSTSLLAFTGTTANNIDELDLPTLRAFRQTWKDEPLSASRKLQRLRMFFKFCVESGWIESNPAKSIVTPKWKHRPTLPFSKAEVNRILECATNPKTKALVLLLRYAGLRLGDAACLSLSQVEEDRILVRTAKSGTTVHIPLPPQVLQSLYAFDRKSQGHFFWSGVSTADTMRGLAGRELSKVFKAAGIVDGHAHRFRDTFAVALLTQGCPIEHVSVLLGHSSVRVTEQYYSPWVTERQARVDAYVRSTWVEDEMVAASSC